MQRGDVFTIVIVGLAVVADFLTRLLTLRDYRGKTPNRATRVRMLGGFIAAAGFLVLNLVWLTS